MKLTYKQTKQLEELKKEGKIIKNDYFNAKEEYEKAKERELKAIQHVLDNNIFVYAETYEKANEYKGERITNPKEDYLIEESIYIDEFLPKLQQAYITLFNIDNPLNFVYTHPFQEKYYKLEKQYLKIAVNFLSISGHGDYAEKLNKDIDEYLKEEYRIQLLEINNEYLK